MDDCHGGVFILAAIGAVLMKKPKKTIPGARLRNFWTRNPRTRVHDNDPGQDIKKLRQSERKDIRNEMADPDQE
jgi:hypothetical protein